MQEVKFPRLGANATCGASSLIRRCHVGYSCEFGTDSDDSAALVRNERLVLHSVSGLATVMRSKAAIVAVTRLPQAAISILAGLPCANNFIGLMALGNPSFSGSSASFSAVRSRASLFSASRTGISTTGTITFFGLYCQSLPSLSFHAHRRALRAGTSCEDC